MTAPEVDVLEQMERDEVAAFDSRLIDAVFKHAAKSGVLRLNEEDMHWLLRSLGAFDAYAERLPNRIATPYGVLEICTDGL